MDPSTKELTSIAVSETGLCQPCFKHHLGKVLEPSIGKYGIGEMIALAERVGEAGANACPISLSSPRRGRRRR
jgi:hypothetical protein